MEDVEETRTDSYCVNTAMKHVGLMCKVNELTHRRSRMCAYNLTGFTLLSYS